MEKPAVARAGLTADRLARAGAELADEIGFEQVTVAGLARRFNVKPASLYSHVVNSADLKARVALVALADLADRASEAVAGRSREAALAALGNSYRDYAREHPGRFAAMQLRLDSDTAPGSAGPRHTRHRAHPKTGNDESMSSDNWTTTTPIPADFFRRP